MDDADHASQQADNMNSDALLEHQRKMVDMEFVKLEEGTECCECSRKIGFTTKARKDSGLCGECWDYYYKGKNLNKFREGY
jgi:RNA polymerase-binding transcription factor DksA